MGRKKLVQDCELLAAAREEFMDHGIAATTRAIARRAGISEAVIYQRYATKHELFFAAMVPPPAPDLLALLESQSSRGGQLGQLETIAICTLDYFRQLLPVLLPVLGQSEMSFEEFAQRHPDSPLEQLRNHVLAFFKSVHPSPKSSALPESSARTSALALVALLQGLALFEQLGAHGGRFSEEEVRGVTRMLWHGVSR